jgi:signal transduction histidine kinase/ligand-binding sensor domain-containing protein
MCEKQIILKRGNGLTRYLLLVLILCQIMSFGQSVEIRNVSFPRGRSLSMITGMDQDQFGYIWFTTHADGLLRFDGSDLERFPLKDTNLGASQLETLHIDKSGKIWVGGMDHGLYQIDPITKEQTHYVHDKNDEFSLLNNNIRAILEDRNGTLWVGTEKGLDTLDRATGKFYRVNGKSDSGNRLIEEHVRAIYQDKENTIWIGCGSATDNPVQEQGLGGLYKIDDTSKEITKYSASPEDPNSLINPNVRALFEDSRGVFWVGTAGDGLHTFDRKSEKFTRYPYDPNVPFGLSRPKYNPDNVIDHITFINEDPQGFIWIGTLVGGLNRYDPEKDQVTFYGPDQAGDLYLNRTDHWASLRTNDGSLWVSNNWTNIQLAEQRLIQISAGLTNQSFYNSLEGWVIAFAEDDNGTLWIGTTNGIYRRNEDGSHTNYQINNLNNMPGLNNIFDVEPSSKGIFCLSRPEGVFLFDSEIKQFKQISNDHQWYGDLHYDREGVLWITTSEGLDKFDTVSQKITHLHKENQNLSNLPKNMGLITEDNQENLWITSDDGLVKLDKKTSDFEIFGYDEKINQISFDQEGVLWGVSPFSLFKFNTKTNSFFNIDDSFQFLKKEGYPNGGMSLSESGKVWVEKNNHLIQYDPESGNAVMAGPNWINPGRYLVDRMLYQTKDNHVTVGANGGYYLLPGEWPTSQVFYPKPFLLNLKTSKRAISLMSNSSKTLDEEIQLGSSENYLVFEFGNVDFGSFENEQNPQYKLDNYDKKWNSAKNINKASYTNLRPGRYVFHFRAANKFGKISEVHQAFVINSPWYQTVWAYIIYALIFVGLIFTFDKFMRRRLILKERERSREKELVQAKEIKQAYTELKSTQSQLVQSEKMASLGELTAGIAHEIQNPLNFVNNFSEVNKELIDELKEERAKEKEQRNDVLEEEILTDINNNLDKINHHGQRASAIVKGMLQHSRSSDGKKEPTDINALADEYLRLAYHGLRAKDKTFNATLETDFDDSIDMVNIVSQDIGRVILNLITNAFYVVDEKKKAHAENYEPTVTVSTKKEGKKITIKVADNGSGIPKKVLDKIFQPFFTTKPTGQGTGLGLSLSYDIVKAHGGELKVETKEGEGLPAEQAGTQFNIILPI